ncbi:1-acyl-sn-glycerol-3-phosphate acyltransferase alpha-like [Haliotis rufescens]|uniref:1-acyl-sn-glycerol-3-phosphate acyltransferase alpha-like n=1 Tax=Haliotis rufescens TaxID=6454 RepID=UPI00201F36A0|nr:1-acyl-sn-glycerol-3-phosphate acyltransferase alpha-like [Haliotis rufescens]
MYVWVVLLVFLLVLPVLLQISHTLKYYVKFAIYYVLLTAIGSGVTILSLFKPKDLNNFSYAAVAFNLVRKAFGIHTEVIDEENLRSDEPYILVSNHQSSLDLMGMAVIKPPNCTCLAKKEIKYAAGPFGLAIWLSGGIFIDRLDKEKAMSTMAKTADIINRDKCKVWIFPEGKRNHGGSLLPFKKGAFHLAVQAKVPVVPVVFSSYSGFYDKENKHFDTGRFTITCLPPVPTTGMTSDDVTELTDNVYTRMLEVYNRTSPPPSGGCTH